MQTLKSSQFMRRSLPANLAELKVKAAALAGHTVEELAKALGFCVPAESKRAKGFVGQLVEAALGADPRAADRPDFPNLGVELKTIPIGPTGRPVESTFCCSIHMADTDRQNWENSRLRQKLSTVLWVPIEAGKLLPLGERRFGWPQLWSPDETQLKVLKADWQLLIGEVGAGRPPTAHLGQALQIRPKAQNSFVRTWGSGPDGPEEVLPLGFYLRARFTAFILSSNLIEVETLAASTKV